MDNNLNFTRKQSVLITSAVASIAFAVIASLIVAVFYYGNKFVSAYSSILLPPVAAVILAKVVQPMFDAIRRGMWKVLPGRLRQAHVRTTHSVCTTVAIVLVLAMIFVPIVLFFRFFGALIWQQLLELPGQVKDLVLGGWEKVPRLRAYLDSCGITPVLKSVAGDTSVGDLIDPASLAGKAKALAMLLVHGVPAFIGACSGWLLLPIYLAIFLASRPFDGHDLSDVIICFSERTRNNIAFLVNEFIRIVVSYFRGQVLVGLIEGALFGLGFQFIAHVHYGLILGLLVGVVGIVPYMGNVFVMPIVCLYAYFGESGGLSSLVQVLLIWGALEIVDLFLAAKIQGGQTGLNNFAVIFSLVFWGSVLGGISGVFLAVPLTAFIVVFWRLLKREWFVEKH